MVENTSGRVNMEGLFHRDKMLRLYTAPKSRLLQRRNLFLHSPFLFRHTKKNQIKFRQSK